jgi:hypothetical protein
MSHIFIKIFMALLGLVLLVFLLTALGLYMVWATLRWLLTGRKPQVVMVWQQFSAMRRQFGQAGDRFGSGASFARAHRANNNNDQVVDVQAREVVDDAVRLPPS